MKDTAEHIDMTEVTGDNAGLRERTSMFDRRVVELENRPHLDVFQQDRLIPPQVDLHLKMIPVSEFFCKSAAPGNNQNQERFKVVIEHAALLIHTKQLTSEGELAHRELLTKRPMKLPYSRVQVKHLSIPQNQTSYNFDVFTGVLPDIVIVGHVADADFAGHYNRNQFNFQNFGVHRIDLRRNGIPVPRFG